MVTIDRTCDICKKITILKALNPLPFFAIFECIAITLLHLTIRYVVVNSPE